LDGDFSIFPGVMPTPKGGASPTPIAVDRPRPHGFFHEQPAASLESVMDPYFDLRNWLQTNNSELELYLIN
jgi:hypothetical protein